METLYNGIVLPNEWPPKHRSDAKSAPYLENPPERIPLDHKRQLFVDDFLIERTTLARVCHSAVKRADNPVFRPETAMERETLPGSSPKSGGIAYVPEERKYKLWYEAGWLNKMAYAESDDGLRFTRPNLDVEPGTNRILPELQPDSTAVIYDPDCADEQERYKAFLRPPGGLMSGWAMTSPDGIHWTKRVPTTPVYDRSTMFYNPFRKKWVYSIRWNFPNRGETQRARKYRECDDYLAGATWREEEAVDWLATDELDLPEPGIDFTPQLYNFDAAAYESVMLGMFEIHLGPENNFCEKGGFPKLTELVAAYSRDGYHFTRPTRAPLIPAARGKGDWDRGYVQSVGGLYTLHGDEIWLYYIGFQGDEANHNPDWTHNGMYANSAMGVAALRRDGFASMEGKGELLTRKLALSEGELCVNANGRVRAEALDERGNALEGFSAEDCMGFDGNATRAKLTWKGGAFSAVSARVSRLRFLVDGALYAFWTE